MGFTVVMSRILGRAVNTLLCLLAIPTTALAQWQSMNLPSSVPIKDLLFYKGTLFAATEGNGIFASSNNGDSWGPRNTGLTQFTVAAFAHNDQYIFASVIGSGIYRSSNMGATWQLSGNGITTPFIGHLAAIGNVILAGADRALFRSDNNGDSWQQVAGYFEVYNIEAVGSVFFLTHVSTLRRSTDLGLTWENIDSFPRTVIAVAQCGSLYVASAFQVSGRGDLYVSRDGVNWAAVRAIPATDLACANSALVVGTLRDGTFVSPNDGYALHSLNAGLTDRRVTSLAVNHLLNDPIAFAGTTGGQIFRRSISQPDGVAVSAASYEPLLPPGSIAAIFSANISDVTMSATAEPLPTSLAGISANLTGLDNIEHPLGLFFVSPGQVNVTIPASAPEGGGLLQIITPTRLITCDVTIKIEASAIFAANADGTGPPAAYVVRVKSDNTQIIEPVIEYDAAQGRFVPLIIRRGNSSDSVFLVLFGCGFASAPSPHLPPFTVSFYTQDGQPIQGGAAPSFRGPSSFVGVSQLNVAIPTNLFTFQARTYSVVIVNNGNLSNAVTVRLSSSSL